MHKRRHQHLVGLCLTHARLPQESYGIWRQCSFKHGWEKRQRQVRFCDLYPSDADGMTSKNESRFYWCLSFLDGSCVVSLEGLPWHFSKIAQLFGMITGNHHFSDMELCIAHWPATPQSPAAGGDAQLVSCWPRIRSYEIQRQPTLGNSFKKKSGFW